MAELGIIASVIGIVGAGTKLSIVIFDFAASVGASGRELQNIATEISDLCSVLKQLQSVLENAHFRPSETALESALRIIAQCNAVFTDIDEIVGEVRRAKGDELFPTVDFVGKVKWTFSKKAKVLMLRSTLEACKSTLSVMLVTMLLAERVSQRRLSTDSTLVEEEQDKAVTQSLVIAQQCAVEQLEFYEDEVEKELEAEMQSPALRPASIRSSVQTRRGSKGRLAKMFSGISVATDLPNPTPAPPRLPTRTERASIWLDSILAPPNEPKGPHPGKQRQKRMSSVGTQNAPLQLLRKWTDQADNIDSKPKIDSPIPTYEDDAIWRHAHFSFSSSSSTPALTNGQSSTSGDVTPIPGIKKTPTDLVSPKTARVQSIGYHLVVGVDGALESSSSFLTKSAPTNETYEDIAKAIMAEHGASLDVDNVTLCVSYGGKTKVLTRDDRPLEVLRHFEDMELDPRLFIRRTQGSAG